MKTPLISIHLLVFALVLSLGAVSFGQAQSQPKPQPKETPSLQTVNAKLDRIIQQQGGRYIFLVSSSGDLWRLDTFTGQLAILNMVSGAEWDTLDIPEKTLRPGNSFYEQFVQRLNKIDFNTN